MYSLLFSLLVQVPTCSNMVHIGDSLTLHSKQFQAAEYKKIGFPDAIISAAGSRSVFTKMPNDPHTGLEAVRYYKKRVDKDACWVIALGTNDTGLHKPEAFGNNVSAVMRELKGKNVAWVSVWKGWKKGNNRSATLWNVMLEDRASRNTNMHVVGWDRFIQSRRFLLNPDKVHYGSTGSKLRAQFISKWIKKNWLEQ
jgi:hypothetical protein